MTSALLHEGPYIVTETGRRLVMLVAHHKALIVAVLAINEMTVLRAH
jgi:hypothetical protein